MTNLQLLIIIHQKNVLKYYMNQSAIKYIYGAAFRLPYLSINQIGVECGASGTFSDSADKRWPDRWTSCHLTTLCSNS